MPKSKRTGKEIKKSRRRQAILDALYIFDAPPQIDNLIASYTTEAEFADAEDIEKIDHSIKSLFRCFRDTFNPRYKGEYSKTKEEIYQYITLKQELFSNMKWYHPLLYIEPSCHIILLSKFQEAFSFMNKHGVRMGPESIGGEIAEGPTEPWETLTQRVWGDLFFPELYYEINISQ